MARKARITVLYVVVNIIFLASLYHLYLPYSIPFATISHDVVNLRPLLATTTTTTTNPLPATATNHASYENLSLVNLNLTVPPRVTAHVIPHVHASGDAIPTSPFSTTSVLMPDWEVLVIVSPEDTPSLLASLSGHAHEFVCVYYTKEVMPATPSANLSFPDRATFRCLLPLKARRKLPFKQPALMRLPVDSPESLTPAPLMLYWTNLVYDSLTADDNDVVLFVKGVIKKQDLVREPSEFRCVFGDDVINGVRTAVKTSTLEVFRCQRPKLTANPPPGGVKVSLEILTEKRVVPTVAYYGPAHRKLASPNGKSVLCACTMVYNVAKFLKEWVYYHSKIGVVKFVLYDNGSDDDLASVVKQLKQEGYDVITYSWVWPKTQEAGFSHAALYAKQSCTWMMYVDVDEFVYSTNWTNSTQPSKSMLQSLLHHQQQNDDHAMSSSSSSSRRLQIVGQVRIWCHEYGPSNQTCNPITGVTQGYICRLRSENRHKSIVLLDAVDDSLYNVIHHFKLKIGYRSVRLSSGRMIVNHYKYQAWPEFKAKFRRRVSAYVVDWTQPKNLNSQDRPRGLGSTPVEPRNWATSYCQVYDTRLRDLTQKWFAVQSPSGLRMPWQR